MNEKVYLVPLAYKEVLRQVGIVCLILAAPLFFVEASAAITVAVFGILGIVLRKLHGRRTEAAAGVCLLGALTLWEAMIFNIAPWNILGGLALLVAGAYLWSVGF